LPGSSNPLNLGRRFPIPARFCTAQGLLLSADITAEGPSKDRPRLGLWQATSAAWKADKELLAAVRDFPRADWTAWQLRQRRRA